MVVVTHEEEIAAYTNRIIRFRDGEIVSDEKNIPCWEPEEIGGGKDRRDVGDAF